MKKINNIAHVEDISEADVFVNDIESLTRDEWLSMRRYGIGGSDSAKIMGDSKWAIMRQLFWDKTGQPDAIPKEKEDNWIRKEQGHYLEPLILKIFGSTFRGWKPFTDRRMFRHPVYKFMLADCDAFVRHPSTGELFILEMKTTSYNSKKNWGKDDSNVVPADYEWQGRHYMAVTGCNKVIYLCLCDGELLVREVNRDLEIEAELVEAEKDFWENYVEAGIEPPFTEDPDRTLQALKEHYFKQDGMVRLEEKEFLDAVKAYLDANAEKRAFEKQKKAAEAREKQALIPILDALKGKDGIIPAGDREYVITQSVTCSRKLLKEDHAALRAEFPEAYEKYVREHAGNPRTTVKERAAR